MRIDFDLHADTCILRLKGRFVTGSEAEYLSARDNLERLAFRTLLVDCREVPYLDSTGISFVVGLLKTVAESGGQFGLLAPNGRVREVLKICHLDKLVPIIEAESAAAP